MIDELKSECESARVHISYTSHFIDRLFNVFWKCWSMIRELRVVENAAIW